MTRRRAVALAAAALIVATSCHSIDSDAFAHGPVPTDVLPFSEPIKYSVGNLAGQPVPLQNGLLGSYFNGAQYRDDTHNEYLVFQRIDPNINFVWDASDTNPVIPADNGGIDHNDGDPRLPDHWPIFSIVWEGYLAVPFDDLYQLRLHVNNGGWIQMKDPTGALANVVSCPGGSGFEGDCDSDALFLHGGSQYIRISYYNNAPSSADAIFSWKHATDADFSVVGPEVLYTQLKPVIHTPTLSTFPDAAVTLGRHLFADGAFVDTDPGDSWGGTVDYGDGGGPQILAINSNQSFSLAHRYVTEGAFTVTVVITDSTGLQGTTQFHVTVTKPAKPVTTTSWYVHTTKADILKDAGCQDATAYKDATLTDGLIILFFGKADKTVVDGQDVFGAVQWIGGFKTTSQIAAAAESYLTGLYNCSDPSAYFEVAIGTSNCTYDPECVQSQTTFAHGAAWARMVRDVNTWISDCAGDAPTHCFRAKVLVQGANDMELAWETAANSAAWAKGFDSEHAAFYYNFGAADGCPFSGTQDAADLNCRPRTEKCQIVDGALTCQEVTLTWKQSEVAYVAWDNASALPVPQIYTTGVTQTQAKQWQRISRQHSLTHDGEAIQFPAPLSQRRACLQDGTPDAATCNTPDQTWTQLFDQLWSDSATYTDDISWRWSTDMGKLWLR